jgi:hypothetical protein
MAHHLSSASAVRAADFDLGRARLLCCADRPRNIGLRDSDRAAAHDCVSWAFMAKPSINSTLTIKFSVRHAIERFHYRATNETRAFQGQPKAREDVGFLDACWSE